MGRALLTDLYELNMAAGYLRRGMTEPATFSLFVRRLPPTRGFLVASGLEAVLSFLEGFQFEQDELDYLAGPLGFDGAAVAALRDLRFTGEVWAVPEGTVVFADEPLLEVTAPLPEAQIVETFLLNQVTLHTTLASKAARCVIAAQGRDLVDFSFRRTQGLDAAMAAARTSAVAGFQATSNVEAARRLGLTAAGTMAHSFVEAFPSEADAFRAFAQDFPDRATFLVDTYDTVEGARNAVRVIREAGLAGRLGVRLDSGDLASLSRRVRTILDDAGLGDVRIFASGGLDEFAIERLVSEGAPIDAFGVGTRVGVSADAPFVDTVYKLVEYADRPMLKLSPGKATAPGRKQVFRGREFEHDVLGLRDEPIPAGTRPLLEPLMREGRRVGPPEDLADARARLEADLAGLPDEAKALRDAVAPAVGRSPALDRLVGRATDALKGVGRDADRT